MAAVPLETMPQILRLALPFSETSEKAAQSALPLLELLDALTQASAAKLGVCLPAPRLIPFPLCRAEIRGTETALVALHENGRAFGGPDELVRRRLMWAGAGTNVHGLRCFATCLAGLGLCVISHSVRYPSQTKSLIHIDAFVDADLSKDIIHALLRASPRSHAYRLAPVKVQAKGAGDVRLHFGYTYDKLKNGLAPGRAFTALEPYQQEGGRYVLWQKEDGTIWYAMPYEGAVQPDFYSWGPHHAK